jgi:hypothetical protein
MITPLTRSCDYHPQVASKGVDSVGPGFANPADVVKTLARQKRE